MAIPLLLVDLVLLHLIEQNYRRQIEAARRAMTRYIKRGGNIWIRIFPDKPITKKPLEVEWVRVR